MYSTNKQQNTLSNTLSIARRVCPFLSISKVSKLNVENVLKPPQNPVITKSFQDSFRAIFS